MQCDFAGLNTTEEVLRAIGLCINGLTQIAAKIGYDANMSNKQRLDIMFPAKGYGEAKTKGVTSTFEIHN